MSNCVGCGWCCVAFNVPAVDKSAGHACEYLEYIGHANQGYYVCSIHERKPQMCREFSTPGSRCPIGAEKLNKCGGIDRWITFNEEGEYDAN